MAKSVLNYFEIFGEIYAGLPEIGMASRDIVMACGDYKCLLDTIPSFNTIVPMYFIIAGTGPNEGVVISKDRNGPANIRTLSDDTWYLL